MDLRGQRSSAQHRGRWAWLAALVGLALPARAMAQSNEATPTPQPASPAEPASAPDTTPTPPPAPAPYSLPWQLRSAAPANVVRLDNSFASYENAASKHGFTVVTALSGGVKLTPNVGVVARLTSAQDSPPVGNGGLILANPVLGGVYGVTIGDVRLAGSLAFTLPVGGGGGSSPGPGALDARSSGAPARMAMDNSIFAVNDFALIPGVDAAYVSHGLTVQVEATLFQLWRVRGGAVQHEAAKTNFTSGLHVGYFVLPVLSFGADLRYQHWLNPPFGAPGVDIAASDPRIDQVSIAVGPRAHFHLGRTFWLRPGVAYSRGLDKPLGGATPNYHVVQVDIPFAF